MYRKAETIYREAETIYCKAGMIYRKAETIYHRQETISRKATRYLAGLEKYLNSTLPVGQVTLKFCLPGGLLHLPNFSNSLIIHEPMNGSQTTGVF